MNRLSSIGNFEIFENSCRAFRRNPSFKSLDLITNVHKGERDLHYSLLQLVVFKIPFTVEKYFISFKFL